MRGGLTQHAGMPELASRLRHTLPSGKSAAYLPLCLRLLPRSAGGCWSGGSCCWSGALRGLLSHCCKPDIRLPTVPVQIGVDCCRLAEEAVVFLPYEARYFPCKTGHNIKVDHHGARQLRVEMNCHCHIGRECQSPILEGDNGELLASIFPLALAVIFSMVK